MSGAGAVALNVVLSKTNAAIEDSTVTATTGDVTLNATGNSAITATVIAASLAVGGGVVGVAASIGVAISKNMIGWRLDGSSDAAEVRATIRNSSVTAGGNLRLTSVSGAKISALVFAGSVAVGGGLGALGLAGSGVFVENRIQVVVQSAIDGDGPSGISAATVSLDASDASTVTAFAGAVALAAAFGGVGAALSIGVSLARNDISNDVEASISNTFHGVVARVGAITLDARELATINAVTAAAALAASGGFFAGVALSGAGADATNAIYTKTRAFLLESTLRAATDVFVHANGSATINALVLAFSAAVGVGFIGIGASIGVSLARNMIGWNPSAYDATSDEVVDGLDDGSLVLVATGSLRGNIYKYVGTDQTGPVDLSEQDYTSTDWELQNGADYSSDQTLDGGLAVDKTVRIANGPGAGDVFKYIGPAITVSVDLRNQDYRNTSLWEQLNLSSTPAEVSATSTDSSIVAGGGVSIVATSTNTINAIVATLSAAISGGAVGIGLSGAGASATNLIKGNVTAKIEGDDGINASSVLVAADDSSSITAFTGSASIAAVVGAFLGGSVSIAVALALNEISSDVSASIDGAGGLTTVPEFTDTDSSAAVKVGDRVRHGTTTYRYVGADATRDLTVAAQYSDTTLWLPVSTTVFASTSTSAAVQPGHRVTVGTRVYEYVGAASTLNLTTESYTDSTRWRLAALVGDVTVTATNSATIASSSLAASGAAGASIFAGLALAGAGARAVNVILGSTKAFVTGSALSSAGGVNVSASDSATITATVLTVAASLGIGLVAGAVSIGIVDAKNLIGEKLDETPQAAQVWAYITSSSVEAGGSVVVRASESATINASIVSAAGAGALGLIAIAVAGASVTIANVVRTDVRAYISDTTDGGIDAHEAVDILASDTSTITALALAVSFSVAIGAGIAGAISLSKAINTISTSVQAYATSAKIATTTGRLKIEARESATVTTTATAASRAISVLISAAGSGATAEATISTTTSAYADPVELDIGGAVIVDAISTGTALTGTTGNASADGLISIAGAVAKATSTVKPTVASRLGGYGDDRELLAAGSISVGSTLAATAGATATGGSFASGFSVSVGETTATASILPNVADAPMVTATITGGHIRSSAGGINVTTNYNNDDSAKVTNGTGATALSVAASGGLIATSGAQGNRLRHAVPGHACRGRRDADRGDGDQGHRQLDRERDRRRGRSSGRFGRRRQELGAGDGEQHRQGADGRHRDGRGRHGAGCDDPGREGFERGQSDRDGAGRHRRCLRQQRQQHGNSDRRARSRRAHRRGHAGRGLRGDPRREANDSPEADATTKGVAKGLAALGGSLSTVTVTPKVLAYIGLDSLVKAGSVTVKAIARPVSTGDHSDVRDHGGEPERRRQSDEQHDHGREPQPADRRRDRVPERRRQRRDRRSRPDLRRPAPRRRQCPAVQRDPGRREHDRARRHASPAPPSTRCARRSRSRRRTTCTAATRWSTVRATRS